MKFLTSSSQKSARTIVTDSKQPVVTFFHRRPLASHHSIEFIFTDVRARLEEQIQARVVTSKFESRGLLKRLYNVVEAVCSQGTVNHITGDINYIGIFLSKDKTIQTILDCSHQEIYSGFKRKILRLFWVKIPVCKARWVTAISTSTKNEILKYTNCDPDKIVVIPVAISERFKRKDKPFDKVRPRILQIGTAPNKNIPRLVEALKGFPCTLDIIGHWKQEYKNLLQRNNIAYSYVSGLSADEILRKYEEADIVTLVSTYEGFGMPILEGQAVGRPVITSNTYSMPEVAGDAACLVDPHDVISIRKGFRTIIDDDQYRHDLVRKGFENVKRFDPNRIAAQYLSLYQKVASV